MTFVSSLIEQLVADVTEATFFKELCFTGQTFATMPGDSKELADVYVWMETESLVIQVKERDDSGADSPGELMKWFKRKVLSKASDQIADSIRFLNDYPDIAVENARGRQLTLGELNVEPRHNVIVYGSLSTPDTLRGQDRVHHSKRSGCIHLIEAADFCNLLHLTVTPRELFDYLRFREEYLEQHSFGRKMSEKWLFGRFVHTPEAGDTRSDSESWDGESVVDRLVNDVPEINLRRFFDLIGEWAANRDGGTSIFHKLILECAHLERGVMREFKRRALRCQQRLDKPAPDTLYRLLNPARDCVFVFGVLPEEMLDEVEIGAMNLVQLAKYECRYSKALGLFSTPAGNDSIATTPVYLECPWERTDIGEAMMRMPSPFPPLKSGKVFNYFVQPPEDE